MGALEILFTIIIIIIIILYMQLNNNKRNKWVNLSSPRYSLMP